MLSPSGARDDGFFSPNVGDGVRGHVKEEEVSFLSAKDALVGDTLCEALPDLLELVSDFHNVPRFS
jgi:hypothetical protein